ncbi:MAG: hypothetical protein LBL99_03915, partial [Holosporaceae bacterium]|nr:hypothetical protein [Holosporaceae bacterium]
MIKRIAFLFSLTFFQTSFCELKVEKYDLGNGVDIVLHEDFKSSTVVVGVIFHVGLFDVPFSKRGVFDFIGEDFISKEAYEKLADLGISCSIVVTGRYTEVRAQMRPEYVKNFFKIIFENKFSPTNF